MTMKIIVSLIFIVYLNTCLSIKCPKDPKEWCKSREIAEACGATDKCFGKTQEQMNRVNLSIYYETLCSDCKTFITSQVWNAYQSILNIVNMTFIPYGNAKEVYRPETKLYQFYCQHGAEECYGNTIHACVINFYPKTEQHLPFIHCMASTEGDVETVASECAEKTSIDYEQVTACSHSRLGNQLQHAYAVQTANLDPVHTCVPWVTINGVHTDEMEKQAEEDLIGLICKSYEGSDSPVQCTGGIES